MMGRHFSIWALGLLVLGGQAGQTPAAGPEDARGPALFPTSTLSIAVEGPSLASAPSSDAGPSLTPLAPRPAEQPTTTIWHRPSDSGGKASRSAARQAADQPPVATEPVPPASRQSEPRTVRQPAAPRDNTSWVPAQPVSPRPTNPVPRMVMQTVPSAATNPAPNFQNPAPQVSQSADVKPPSQPRSLPEPQAVRQLLPAAPPAPDRGRPIPLSLVAATDSLPTHSQPQPAPMPPAAAQPAQPPAAGVLVAQLSAPPAAPSPGFALPAVVPPPQAVSAPVNYPATTPDLGTPMRGPGLFAAGPQTPPMMPAGNPQAPAARQLPQAAGDPNGNGPTCGGYCCNLCERLAACSCCWCDRALDCSCTVCDRALDCYDDFCGQGGVVTANVGFMILAPKWGNNPAFNAAIINGATIHSQQSDFDYSTQFAPRVQLGFVSGNGLGARVGWWGFGVGNGMASVAGSPAVSASPLGLQISTVPLVNPTGLVLATGSHLQLNVWDFEATENFQCGCWSLLGSAGLRYAHLGQSYIASVYGPTGAAVSSLSSGHSFDGFGPTVSLGGKRHIGNSPFYLYGNTRGSLLFGSTSASATTSGGTEATALATSTAYGNYDSILPVAEVELGFGFYRSLQNRYRFFAETGVIGMAWFNAGNPSGSYVPPGAPFNTTYSPTTGTLGLIGLSARCGVNF